MHVAAENAAVEPTLPIKLLPVVASNLVGQVLEDKRHEALAKNLTIVGKSGRSTFLIGTKLFAPISFGLGFGELVLKSLKRRLHLLLVSDKLTKKLLESVVAINGIHQSKSNGRRVVRAIGQRTRPNRLRRVASRPAAARPSGGRRTCNCCAVRKDRRRRRRRTTIHINGQGPRDYVCEIANASRSTTQACP